MQQVKLPTGDTVPALGQGTWFLGENPDKRAQELAALRLGLDLGMTLLDTAEMYGEGDSEKLIAEVIADRRPEVFIVSKVYPHNATRTGAVAACERSLKRLNTDYIDLYLLHWRGSTPLAKTLEAFESLRQAGKIRAYGVSNFDQRDMEELMAVADDTPIATDQVLYNLHQRGIEWDLLPWCRARGIPVMAYAPFEHAAGDQRDLLNNPSLKPVATRHDATPAQVALAWLLRQQDIIVIPKAGTEGHVRENRAALDITLDDDDLTELDRGFPPPRKKMPLAIK